MTSEVILNKLLTDKDYFIKTFPYLKRTDFKSEEKFIYDAVQDSYQKYKKPPTLDEMKMYFEITNTIMQSDKVQSLKKVYEIANVEYNIDLEKMVDYTEKYISDIRFDQVLELGIQIREGLNKKLNKDDVKSQMEEALKTSFKSSGGHDWNTEYEQRFLEYGKREEEGITSPLEIVNKATGGGFAKKQLTLYASVSNGGKTTFLCNEAVNAVLQGKNVAYYTFEESELEINFRIDQNVLDLTQDELKQRGISLSTTFESILTKNIGKLKVKAYAPRSASTTNMQAQLDEWRMKENFIPDLIISDSITIMSPSVTIQGNGLYQTGKQVGEDLKGLIFNNNCAGLSAVQLGRDAYGSTNPNASSISESIAIFQVASAVLSVVIDENRPDIRIIAIQKSRSLDKVGIKPVVVKIDTTKQRVWDLDEGERKYIKQEQKDELHNMEHLINVAEKIKDKDDVNDDFISNMLSGNY